ncbi:golgin subfamily A member 6-like protein 2 [Physella acuta]|uniref:golgin subfamily A member 6-like protein 2 n=1 Tax=Physella acuta TaxID=109671 RepID=UPI0027DE7073|nr:golgin subfamily A member 6-like protein 2 [Physella acuta]XP_059151306.1 golgin subfamily A member 6-like protein 2 [Physella acuta]
MSGKSRNSKPADIKIHGTKLVNTITTTTTNNNNSYVINDDDRDSVGSQPHTPSSDTVEQVMSINRRLVTQIETLRLKVEVDTNNHERSKNTLINSTNSELQVRQAEIDELKTDLAEREESAKKLVEENAKKDIEIQNLQQQLDELKEDVAVSKEYAQEIQRQLDQLTLDKTELECGTVYREKDEHINRLQKEVTSLKEHLATLDKELSIAKEKITQQGAKLRFAELDRGNEKVKFKEELAKASQSMRMEVEKLREVMRKQWEEMRELRQQNEGMRSDIKEIRELLRGVQPADQSGALPGDQTPHKYGPSLPALAGNARRKK